MRNGLAKCVPIVVFAAAFCGCARRTRWTASGIVLVQGPSGRTGGVTQGQIESILAYANSPEMLGLVLAKAPGVPAQSASLQARHVENTHLIRLQAQGRDATAVKLLAERMIDVLKEKYSSSDWIKIHLIEPPIPHKR